MRFLLLTIVVGMGLLSPHTSALAANKISNQVYQQIGAAVAKAAPLAISPRLRLLIATDIILYTETTRELRIDVEEMGDLHDEVTQRLEETFKLPAAAERQLPNYMQDEQGLHYDVEEYPLHIAVAAGEYSIAELLLQEKEIDVNAPDRRGRAPIHIAAEVGDVIMTALLIRNGAKLNAKVKQAWHYEKPSAGSKKGKKKKINNKESRGLSAAHLAMSGEHLDVLALLLLEGADFDIEHNIAATPMHIAAAQEFLPALVMLDLAGIDFNTAVAGYSPLDTAVLNDADTAVDFLSAPEKKRTRQKYLNRALLRVKSPQQLSLLLEHGAEHSYVNDTAMFHYAEQGLSDLIRFVISELKSDPNAKDNKGMPILRHALRSRDEATITALLESGADPLGRKKKKRKTHFDKAAELELEHLFMPHMVKKTK